MRLISDSGEQLGVVPIDVALNKEPLVDMNIQGDPRDNPYDAQVKVFPRKKKIKMRKR